MKARVGSVTSAISQTSKSAQRKLSEYIKTYLADYANELIWDNDTDFIQLEKPNVLQRLHPYYLHKNLSFEKAWEIPTHILENQTHNAYIAVGDKLFYFEKSRHKLTEIKLSAAKMKTIAEAKNVSAAEIKDISHHSPNHNSVSEIIDSDPLQIKFYKHSMLALQELEELATNMNSFYNEAQEYMTKEEKNPTQEEKEEVDRTQLGKLAVLIGEIGKTNALDKALVQLENTDTSEANQAVTIHAARGHLAKEMAISAINFIPLLSPLLKIAKPFQQSILLGIFGSISSSVAVYQSYLTYAYYGETVAKVGEKSMPLYEFAVNNRDKIIRPFYSLVHHLSKMTELAANAEMTAEVKNQLNNISAKVAVLQAKVLLNPLNASELLKADLADINNELASVAMNYSEQEPVVKPNHLEEKKLVAPVVNRRLANLLDDWNHLKSVGKMLTHKDVDGYYLSTDQESAINISLKSMINSYIAIDKLAQIYANSENPGSSIKILKHINEALENLDKIDWQALSSVNLNSEDHQLVDEIMTRGMQIISPRIREIIDISHQIELDHHLGFNVLFKILFPLFNRYENIFSDRGLNINLPWQYDELREKTLKVKLEQAKHAKPQLEEKHATLTAVLDALDWYIKWGNELPPEGLRKKMGLYLSGSWQFDLPTELDNKIIFLLEAIAKLKDEHQLDEMKSDIAVFEDRLILGLSEIKRKALLQNLVSKDLYPALREKLAEQNSHLNSALTGVPMLNKLTGEFRNANDSTGRNEWPPKDVKAVLKKVVHHRQQLNSQFIDEKKYQEAINRHKNMRIDILKNEGLISLIDAVNDAENDPQINLRYKRRLAVLIADLKLRDRKSYLENAHEVTTEFVKYEKNLIKLIQYASRIQPKIEHALITEVILASYIDERLIPSNYLAEIKDEFEDKNADLLRQDLLIVLDRLEPRHIQHMLDNNINADLALNAKLLLKALDSDAFNPDDFTLENIAKLLVLKYKNAVDEHDSVIKNKVGLFLGKIVNNDSLLRCMVYLSDDYREMFDIIKTECLEANTRISRAIYSEGVANVFLPFNTDEEFKAYDDFIATNENAITQLHYAAYGDNADIEFYKNNSMALFALLEHFKAINNNDVHDKINSTEEYLKNTYHLSAIDIKDSNTMISEATQAIKKTREQLVSTFKHIFSDYTNRNLLWDEKNSSSVAPVSKDDPAAVNVSKHTLLALEQAEKAGNEIMHMVAELNSPKWKWKSITRHLIEISKALLMLAEQVNELSDILQSTEDGRDIAEKLQVLKKMIEALPEKISNSPQSSQELVSSMFGKLNHTMTTIIKPYLSVKRPAAPIEPERKYTMAKKDNDVSPSIQSKVEWFFLLEPLRNGTLSVQKFHEIVLDYFSYQKSKNVSLSAEEEKQITKTYTALANAKTDENGYYTYENETQFSQTLKALYNISWGINESTRGFSEYTGFMSSLSATTNAGTHATILYNHINKLYINELMSDSSDLSAKMIDSLLVYGRDMIHMKIANQAGFLDTESFTAYLTETELNHHLRLGVLSEPLRPLFYEFEKIFFMRGLSEPVNLFNHDHATEELLNDKINEDNENTDRYRDALREYHKMRSEFAREYLKNEGLIALVQATNEGELDEKLNMNQKRMLAILVADINAWSRADTLNAAHRKMTDFLNTNSLRAFIEKVSNWDNKLGHSLAIEAMLAGYVEYDFDRFNSQPIDDATFINVLNHLEANQILSMVSNSASARSIMLVAILKSQSLEAKNLKEMLAASQTFTKTELIEAITNAYQTLANVNDVSSNAKKSALGSLLGRLARVDADIASTIFREEGLRRILQNETIAKVPNQDSSLYYESLVNSFDYHQGEFKDTQSFIDANRSLMLNIYYTKMVDHASEADNDEMVINLFKENPILVLTDIENFMKNKVSLGSDAENKLRRIASDFILCADNVDLRFELLRSQNEAHGSQNAMFLEILTSDATNKFWELVVADLDKKLKSLSGTFKQLTEQVQINSNDPLSKDFAAYKASKESELKEVVKSYSKFSATLKSFPVISFFNKMGKKFILNKNDPRILECRKKVQEIMDVEKKMREECLAWDEKANPLVKKSKLQNNIKMLPDKLMAIQKKLAPFAMVKLGLSSENERARAAVIATYSNEFGNLAANVAKKVSNSESYNEMVGSALEKYDSLAMSCKALKDQQTGYSAGLFGLPGKLKSVFNSDAEFEKTLNEIEKIIGDIKQTLVDSPTAHNRRGSLARGSE